MPFSYQQAISKLDIWSKKSKGKLFCLADNYSISVLKVPVNGYTICPGLHSVVTSVCDKKELNKNNSNNTREWMYIPPMLYYKYETLEPENGFHVYSKQRPNKINNSLVEPMHVFLYALARLYFLDSEKTVGFDLF